MLLEREQLERMYGVSLDGTYTAQSFMRDFQDDLGRAESPGRLMDVTMQALEWYVCGQFPSRGWCGNPRQQPRLEVFEKSMAAGKMVVSRFYEGEPMGAQEIWDQFYPFIGDFIGFSMGITREGNRHLNSKKRSVLDFVHKLMEDPQARACEHVVFIANGGIEPALIASHYLNIPKITPIAFSAYRLSDEEVCLPFWLYDSGRIEEIEGKNVLLVDDVKSQGTSLDRVTGFIETQKPKSIIPRYVFKI